MLILAFSYVGLHLP